MGQTLFGGEKSGTPSETRAGTMDLAKLYQSMMVGGGKGMQDMFGRTSSEGLINMLGFDPSQMGMDAAARASLADPTNSTMGLFRSMQPFEAQETARQVGGMRDMFGTMGGRFSRNAGEGEAMLRSQLASGFGQNREQALLAAGGQRNNALASMMQLAMQGQGQAFNQQMMPFQLMNQFFQPGAPVYTEGLMPGLLQTGGTLAALAMMGSDSRLKTILSRGPMIQLPGGKVQLVVFEWNEEGEKKGYFGRAMGVIAQELREVSPHLVHEDRDGYLSVDYRRLFEEVE
jgi:hypothetical protein